LLLRPMPKSSRWPKASMFRSGGTAPTAPTATIGIVGAMMHRRNWPRWRDYWPTTALPHGDYHGRTGRPHDHAQGAPLRLKRRATKTAPIYLLRDCGPRRVAALTAGDRDGFGPDIREPPTIRRSALRLSSTTYRPQRS